MRKTLTVALDIGNVCVRLEYENVFRAAGLEPGSALPEDADRAAQLFRTACPDAEVSALPGGQPVYYYIIAIE